MAKADEAIFTVKVWGKDETKKSGRGKVGEFQVRGGIGDVLEHVQGVITSQTAENQAQIAQIQVTIESNGTDAPTLNFG